MSRSILILLGHPDRDSLCGALAQRYATAARNAGHRVHMIALGDLQFDPVLRHGYRQIQRLETDLQDAADAIRPATTWCWSTRRGGARCRHY